MRHKKLWLGTASIVALGFCVFIGGPSRTKAASPATQPTADQFNSLMVEKIQLKNQLATLMDQNNQLCRQLQQTQDSLKQLQIQLAWLQPPISLLPKSVPPSSNSFKFNGSQVYLVPLTSRR